MAQVQKVKGRIIKVFNGEILNKETGAVDNYQPALTIMDDSTFEVYKVKVSPDDFKKFGSMIGQTVSAAGPIEKPAQPAVIQGIVSVTK